MAEDLTQYLKERGIKVVYLHHETKTLERSEIIYQLRKGKYDVLVGINLLREGLDIPEVSLIAILDADKEGFLRSTRSLIQVVGRAARNVNGKAIMYADTITDSMKECISETNRRRAIQQKYNDEIKKIAASQGLKTKPRYSPGYGDVSLEVQKDFFRLLPSATAARRRPAPRR